MKLQRLFYLVLVVLFISCAAIVIAQENTAYKLTSAQQSKVVLKGKSSLHPYSASAATVNVAGLVETKQPDGTLESLAGATVRQLHVIIPVAGLKSNKKELDKNLHEDLKVKTHPEITFKLSEFQMPSVAPSDDSIPITLKGSLSVAGVEKPVMLNAQISYQKDGIHVTGSTPLQMTDFGIKPRKFMLMMKVENQVVVDFDFVINPNELILN